MEEEKKDFEVDISIEGKEKSAGESPKLASKETVEKDKKSAHKGLKKKLEEKEEEVKTLYDKLLRTQAEFENYKKRIEKEKSDLRKYAGEGILREIIHAVDNLEMAIKHASESDQSESISEGIEIILKQLLKSLERFGVKSFVSIGEIFDPNRHEAVVQVESAEHEPNTIIAESQKGYFLQDRLLRPALVTVAKAPQTEADEED
ncbi:MAG: nucleotide exchange factor GrpE [Deltaproteobacteria bacterium]|jgi:molecular chaperone GrpE|nr:nucleotide exchange factor GrpE [Deltaproteobacteria bacterium]MBW1853494.1 nucleotide exchange factor GrpE [Deltaproteobacteria bacterium]